MPKFNEIEPINDGDWVVEINNIHRTPMVFLGSYAHQYGVTYSQAVQLRDWLIRATTLETSVGCPACGVVLGHTESCSSVNTSASLDDRAKAAFEKQTANWSSVTPWGELAEETRQHWRDFVSRTSL